MRLGRLDRRVQVMSLSPTLMPECLGSRWASIRAKDAGDVPAATGLRTAAMVEIRARYNDLMTAGRYLRDGPRLFVITSARDPLATGAELVVSCSELVGERGEYRPAEGPPVPCRAFLQHQAPHFDDEGKIADYQTKCEVAIIETGRVQEGDQMVVSGQLYNVIGYADETDDGIVRGLWLEVV